MQKGPNFVHRGECYKRGCTGEEDTSRNLSFSHGSTKPEQILFEKWSQYALLTNSHKINTVFNITSSLGRGNKLKKRLFIYFFQQSEICPLCLLTINQMQSVKRPSSTCPSWKGWKVLIRRINTISLSSRKKEGREIKHTTTITDFTQSQVSELHSLLLQRKAV